MIEVKGKGCIVVRVIADSVSSVNGKRITTIEAEYPRFIHSEMMTHRLFSRNAASSRAIPVQKMIDSVCEAPAMPVHWGANQSGMQAKEECVNPVVLMDADYDDVSFSNENAWRVAAAQSTVYAEAFSDAGYHKQIVNRLLEPFQVMKTVITATEWDNFFYLRKHPDAQPEIAELAACIYEAFQQSTPETLQPGEWHTPYVPHARKEEGGLVYLIQHSLGLVEEEDGVIKYAEISTENALKISASCCAQVSYRKSDDSLEKALMVYDRLVNSKPVHASPFEHQGTPMRNPTNETIETWAGLQQEAGITHLDKRGDFWSGNFQSWIQYRQLIPENVCKEYKENNNG